MKPELEILQNLISQLDYLLNEGVVTTIEEKAEFIKLFDKGNDLISEFITIE
jgi:predicted transcriptional regulator